MKALVVAAVFGFSVVVASSAVAQEIKIEAKPPAREPRPDRAPHGGQYEQSRPTDRDFYPDGPRVERDPGFIEGLSGEYATGNTTGRAGVSGWTSPNTPVGASVASGQHEVTGWFGLGFSVTWGGPPRVPRRPAQP